MIAKKKKKKEINSFFTSPISHVGTEGYGKMVGRTSIMAIIGGTFAKLGDGKFANGAMSVAFVHLFNAEGMVKNMVNSVLNIVGKIWNSLNTAIGLVYGGVGYLVGLVMGTNPSIQFGHNAIQFINNPFGGVGAITLGNTITYGIGVNPESEGFDKNLMGEHEEQHTYQGQLLGPLYLPVHAVSMLTGLIMDGDIHGSHAFMESGPMSHPPRVF